MSKKFSDNPQVLSSILNSMLDCFIAVDKNISILELNPAAEKILRCSRDTVLGKSLVELIIPPQDHAYYGEQIQHHMETGDDRYLNTRMEITALRADGELFPAELTIIPIETDEKEMFALFLRDVSERRQEQNALAGERKLLRTLIDTMPDYIYIKDLEHRFVLTNIAHAQARGFESPDDLIGKSDFDFFPPEMAAEFHAEEEQIFRTGNPLLNYAQPSKGFAGGFDWALSNKIPLHNLDDELVGLVGITRDITEYKKQERELHRHAMLQDNFTDAVISTDLDYRIRTWNKAAEAIYGWLEEDVIGKDSTAVLGTRFETEEAHQRMLEELYEKGHWLGEVIQQRKDGTELYILGSVNLLKDADGEPFGVVAINHDISERKQHEQKLQRANARFQHLIDNLQGGILLENENHKIELLNDTFREMFQISTPLETLIGADYSQVLQANKDLFVDPEQFIQRVGTIMHDFKLVLDDTLHLKSGLIYERDFIPITVDDTYVGNLWHYRDVTAKVHARQRWERLLKLEELNKEIIRLFVQMDDIDSALNRTLEMTGHLMDVSRVYVFRCREGEHLLDNTHEWCAPGIPAKIDSFQELPFDDLMPSALPMLVQNGIIASQHIDELPDDVRAILEPKNAKSVLILPLNSGNRI
ncbi:MAG: PAS domain S-box protein, partial [Anaerolineae bacterium]|nr:PAS domain S-box protein [Anaerolineae bacterium]